MERSAPHKPLTSKENSAIRRLRSLAEPKHRKKEQAYLIESVKMVEEALRGREDVLQVVAAPSLLRHHGKTIIKLAEARGVEVLWISERLMDAVSESKTPQPVMAVVKMREHSEPALLVPSPGLFVVCHGLQDPGNVGTIIRTAEAVGAAGVGVTPNTADPHSPKAVRASMGSILRVPVVKIGDLTAFLKTCRERGFQTVALALSGTTTHFDLDLVKPTALVVGREGAGLSDDVTQNVDLVVRIPMAETIDSLNVAAAAAVVLYEAYRQRMHVPR